MAKSKSTTTPTKASSSKTKDRDQTGGHRSSRANVSTRSASAHSSPLKRKADDHDGGSRSSKRRAVADNDVTSSHSQQATPAKAVSSKRKDKMIALSEPQSFKNRHPSIFGGVEVKRETPEQDADADGDNICIRPPSPIKPADREKVLDYVLLGTFGFEARQHAVDQLFEAARESASSKADFGVACVEATVSRLKRKGIEEQRLTEVLTMLQDGVYEQVRARVEPLGGPLRLPRARVDSLGGPLPLPLPLPSPLSLPQDFGQVAMRPSSNSNRPGVSDVLESRRSTVVIPHKGKQRSARSESVHTPSDSDSSSDDDGIVVPGSQKNSKFRDDDDEDYVENSNPSAPRHEQVKHEDGMTSFRLARFSQPHTNKIISQILPMAQHPTTDFTERANVTESHSTFLFAPLSLRACLRLATT
jgi:hypothetical protein